MQIDERSGKKRFEEKNGLQKIHHLYVLSTLNSNGLTRQAKVKRKPSKERCGEPAQHKKSSDSQIDLPQIKVSFCDPFHNSFSSSESRQTTTVPKPTNGGLSKQLRASNVGEEAVLKHGQTTHTTKRKRGRPRGRPATKKVNAISRKCNPHISTRSAPLRRKRKRNVSPQHISVLPKKLAKVSTGTMLNGKILKES
ncbi:unnamed protein product, partial [Timema podura]|nr:unnamed protein product [Timema podura]